MLIEEKSSLTIRRWFRACKIEDVPENGGACVKFQDEQIAVFNFALRNEWFACQNECPHKFQMALARGLIGDSGGEPKVACPFHKKSFSLKTGENLNGEDCYKLKVYPVEIKDGFVYIGVE